MAHSNRETFWILVTAIIATIAKLYCAFTTFGTDDVYLYFRYGEVVHAGGLSFALTNPIFNLTPVAAEYPAFLSGWLNGNEKYFPFFLKLPGILAYFGSVLALLWLRRRIPQIPAYALILFAASPVSFMIDGFHGNFDSVMVFLLLLAACACASDRPSWLGCAAFIALACQIKVVALLLTPVFAFYWLHRKLGFRFMIVAGIGIVLGWLPGLLASPSSFMRNVFGYGGVWGIWGVTYLLRLTGYSEFQTIHWIQLTSAQLFVSQLLKLTIIFLVLWVAWRSRKSDTFGLFGALGFAWIAFYALAPGMGMQYMLWFAPFLLVWNARWFSLLTVLVSAILFIYYQTCCATAPWFRADSTRFAAHMGLLLIPWISFVACAIAMLLQFKEIRFGYEEPQAVIPRASNSPV